MIGLQRDHCNGLFVLFLKYFIKVQAKFDEVKNCLISNRGLGVEYKSVYYKILDISQDPPCQKEHTKLYKILNFGDYQPCYNI